MNRTGIEYLDYTTNPLVGCRGINCAIKDHCWARGQMKRRKPQPDGRGCQQCYDFVPHEHKERFDEPYSLKKKSNIGVCFCSDFFDKEHNSLTQIHLLVTMGLTKHNYLILTKQPQNIRFLIPRNVAIGVSINRKEDLWRLDELRKVNCDLRVVSFEPLLEDLGKLNLENIGWVIVGAQTHPTIIPEKQWVDNITVQAAYRNIPIFEKNNLKFFTEIYGFHQFPESWKKEENS